MTTAIEGTGTDESSWRDWLRTNEWPPLHLDDVRSHRVVVLAAHPDDEVLGVGGVMQQLARLGCALTIVWATDGEASHPGSTVFSGEQLAALRRRESQRALARLGVTPASTVHLGLADGALSHHRDALRRRLRDIVGPGDVLLAPWECDGHPDHEIAGAVALEISAATWRYPIWMWHWAEPGDGRVPWQRIRASRVPDVDRKTEAIGEFASQVRPIGPGPADSAILPPDVVARFLRDNEWIIT